MSMMWFITLDNTCLDYPRLSAPNYRHIGSLTRAEANPLKGELKAFVDGANDGMILITFGTTTPGIKTLRHFIPMFRKIAPEIRQRVVLQLSIDDDPGEFPSNIRFERWVPWSLKYCCFCKPRGCQWADGGHVPWCAPDLYRYHGGAKVQLPPNGRAPLWIIVISGYPLCWELLACPLADHQEPQLQGEREPLFPDHA